MTLEEELKNSTPIPPRTRAVLNVLFTASWLDCQMNRDMRKYGLTNPQYNILRILKGSRPDGLSVLDIKSRMIDRSSNVSRLVEKLREQGLVVRTPSSEDRRMVVVTITDSGLELLDKFQKEVMSNEEGFPGTNLSEEEMQQLSVLLDRLRG
jgi:DNA-binding MarR family transcriptional regulator